MFMWSFGPLVMLALFVAGCPFWKDGHAETHDQQEFMPSASGLVLWTTASPTFAVRSLSVSYDCSMANISKRRKDEESTNRSSGFRGSHLSARYIQVKSRHQQEGRMHPKLQGRGPKDTINIRIPPSGS